MVDLTGWTRGEREPGGDEEKRWFEAPVDSEFSGRWLFKPHREKLLVLSKERAARSERPDVLVRGEDWAEKIAYELAQILHVPAVVTELAAAVRTRDGKRVRGSMSRDMRPPNWQSSPGATLLAELDESFDADTCAGHTIAAIKAVLQGLQGPVGTDYGLWTAFDVFVGYLVLDAWIANTDRHAHNWAVLQSPSGAVCLAPTFDHGNALGSGAGERHHARVLESGIGDWCGRGRASRFEVHPATTLVDFAADALAEASAHARSHWPRRLAEVDRATCNDVVERIPNLSEFTRTFIREVLTTNRKRLSDVL